MRSGTVHEKWTIFTSTIFLKMNFLYFRNIEILSLSKLWIILSPGGKGFHVVNNNSIWYVFGKHRFIIPVLRKFLVAQKTQWNRWYIDKFPYLLLFTWWGVWCDPHKGSLTMDNNRVSYFWNNSLIYHIYKNFVH